ncbi:MAG TPA: DUF1127 domain-containing protein [Stellaceae bacterium]|nr:DUF1127 domain-containing protein [Stellaceae bacterium]
MSAAYSDLPRSTLRRAPHAASRGALWYELFTTWLQRRRERAQLLQLTERELRDIGITRCDALREAAKPLWRE